MRQFVLTLVTPLLLVILCGISARDAASSPQHDFPVAHKLGATTRIESPARRPCLTVVGDTLLVSWLLPSPGGNDATHGTYLRDGVEVEFTVHGFGLKPATLEYGSLSLSDAASPTMDARTKISIVEPGGKYPHYSMLAGKPNALCLGYESRYNLLNSGGSVTLLSIPINVQDQASPTLITTVPRRERVQGDRELIQRVTGLTDEEEITATIGRASESESSTNHTIMAMTRHKNSLFMTGIAHDVSSSSIYLRRSQNEGHTWSAPTIIGKGHYPDIAMRNDEVWLIVTDVTREIPFPGISLGCWPDETSSVKNHWPVMGRVRVWKWRAGEKIPADPTILVNDKKAIQASLAIRQDGTMAITYVRDVLFNGKTQLWLTTSVDGVKWSTPRPITDGTHLDRDVDTVFYHGRLIVAFARANHGRQASDIHVLNVKI